MTRGIAILGATGSIGTSALDLIERLEASRPGQFRVLGLAAGRNVDRLVDQVRRHRPAIACIGDASLRDRLREGIAGTGARAVAGPEGLEEVAALEDADWVLAGIVGAAGLRPTFAAASRGVTVALANKE